MFNGAGCAAFLLLSGLAVKLVPDAWRQMMRDEIAVRVSVSVLVLVCLCHRGCSLFSVTTFHRVLCVG